eukprot:COSAG02_NODE_48403_length_334_cov_0.642553_1_plen_23_part_01
MMLSLLHALLQVSLAVVALLQAV